MVLAIRNAYLATRHRFPKSTIPASTLGGMTKTFVERPRLLGGAVAENGHHVGEQTEFDVT